MPGGIPLFKTQTVTGTEITELVGGIGVFFPGPDGYATDEQDFTPTPHSLRNNASYVAELAIKRTNAPLALEAEWMAFAAAGGSKMAVVPVGELEGVPPVPGYSLPSGSIYLAGILLEIYGPHPGDAQAVLAEGAEVGRSTPVLDGSEDMPIAPGNVQYRDGLPPPDGWLVPPQSSASITTADVLTIVNQGIAQANVTRAQIRLEPDGSPGATVRVVFAVADQAGNILGLYRMCDATIFSIDVAVAKARNMAYYDDPALLLPVDRVQNIPLGTAFTNRTVRNLAQPFFPEGINGKLPGSFSILLDPGIDVRTAENSGPANPCFRLFHGAGVRFLQSRDELPRSFRGKRRCVLSWEYGDLREFRACRGLWRQR